VVSKKLIGLLKMAKAILSCNLREAWSAGISVSLLDPLRDSATWSRSTLQNLAPTYLDGAEDPQNQRLDNHKRRRAKAKGKVNAQVFTNFWIPARVSVNF